MFQRAIVRLPSTNFAEGLTTVELGTPNLELAVRQHDAYCDALRKCGLTVRTLAPDDLYPDSTFVEDTAVITRRSAILARPGAPGRVGEVEGIANVVAQYFSEIHSIRDPGTLDGGDICEAGNHFFIGISHRTNESGAEQLSELLTVAGYTTSFVDIRAMNNILHLKSGIGWLGENRLVAIEALINHDAFRGYDLVPIQPGEEYAANCVRINDRVLVAAGYSIFERSLSDLGYETITLEMSEFQKMDGGLSCLSLRF